MALAPNPHCFLIALNIFARSRFALPIRHTYSPYRLAIPVHYTDFLYRFAILICTKFALKQLPRHQREALIYPSLTSACRPLPLGLASLRPVAARRDPCQRGVGRIKRAHSSPQPLARWTVANTPDASATPGSVEWTAIPWHRPGACGAGAPPPWNGVFSSPVTPATAARPNDGA
jgi:hypothetical protein